MINNQDKKLTSDAMFTAARDQYITDINRLLIRSETNTLEMTPKNENIICDLHQKIKRNILLRARGDNLLFISILL
ncbi:MULTISPECIES: hypothetical protein [spotted fever group]|uniref:Uncharacterized protein n=1 Tax=Rickettsia massiliae str. AZT80 TaxID=1105112 RepID=H6QJ43_RICMA|nr:MULTISPECIES: hypothetical protein [spotted fever group]AFB31693.1 hypothetical protein RMB_04560 [Rickettsia massiliae str. AZT80]